MLVSLVAIGSPIRGVWEYPAVLSDKKSYITNGYYSGEKKV